MNLKKSHRLVIVSVFFVVNIALLIVGFRLIKLTRVDLTLQGSVMFLILFLGYGKVLKILDRSNDECVKK